MPRCAAVTCEESFSVKDSPLWRKMSSKTSHCILWHTSCSLYFQLNQHCQDIFLKQMFGTPELCVKSSILPPAPPSLLSFKKSWSQTHHTVTALLVGVGPGILNQERSHRYDLNAKTYRLILPVSGQQLFGVPESSWSPPCEVLGLWILTCSIRQEQPLWSRYSWNFSGKKLFIDKWRPRQVEKCGNRIVFTK